MSRNGESMFLDVPGRVFSRDDWYVSPRMGMTCSSCAHPLPGRQDVDEAKRVNKGNTAVGAHELTEWAQLFIYLLLFCCHCP